MKKSVRIISLILAIIMLTAVFASCDKDNNGDDNETKTTTTTTQRQSTGEKHTVRIIDGITGEVLETSKVTDGKSVNILNDFRNYHYGYALNETKLNSERAVKVIEDTDITLEFTPLETVTVILQNEDGTVYTNYNFEFKKALTLDEIKSGVDEFGDKLVFGDTDDRNDYKTETLSGAVKVYKGYGIESAEMPDAPVTTDTFNKWLVIDGAVDGVGGTPGEEFAATIIEKNAVVRANYVKDGVTLKVRSNLVGLSASNVFAAVTVDPARNITTDGTGNELITYGTETDYATDKSNTTFNFAHGMGTFYYIEKKVNGTRQTTEAVADKFNSYTSDTFAGYEMQIDTNTYGAFDGDYLYLYITVRDDTVYNFHANDLATLQTLLNQGETIGSIYRFGDGLEIRFSLGYDKNGVTSKNDANFDYANKTDDNCLRTLLIDREGKIAIWSKGPTGEGHIDQTEFVEIIDLDPSERKSQVLRNSSGDEDGYAIGLRINIKGFMDESGFDWGTEENKNYFKMVFGIQVNDRYGTLVRNTQSGVEECDYYDDGCIVDKDLIAGGAQAKKTDFSTITLSKW